MILRPIITEKTMKETKGQKFTFQVELGATKTEIKNAVQKMFNVHVLKTQTATMPGKSYRTGKRFKYAYRADWKKAIVMLKPGETIELFDVRETDDSTPQEIVTTEGEIVK